MPNDEKAERRDQFTLYRSFWEAMKALPKKDQLPFITAVCAYALDGECRPLSGAPYASFLLVKPILDKASKKAANGKQGGSKPKAKRKQPESHIEGEKEKEVEREVEVEVEVEVEGDIPPTPQDPSVAAVMSVYLDKINATPSANSLDELKGFVDVMGADCCLRAFDIALAKKATWPYIKAILQDKQSRGVRCLADWDALDDNRRQKQETWEYDPGDTKGWSL